MFRLLAVSVAYVWLCASPALAEGRETIGYGRLINNDAFGDTADRWQSGSVASSRVMASDWTGMLPNRPFELLEYRVGAAIMAPENLRKPAAGDRPFAGALSLGVHTHFSRNTIEYALGADLVFTGPQTGLSAFQTALHDSIGIKPASRSVQSNQVGNGVHPTLVVETGRSYALAGQAVLRPFTELRWGAETLLRAGADLTIGAVGQGELLVRDPVTGQRYRSVSRQVPGYSLVVGGDIARVQDSVFLPASSGVSASESRSRIRTGLHWQGDRNSAFYGVTWMSKEFETQPQGQAVGSVRLEIRF